MDGVYAFRTLEPRADQSNGKPYCIPEGTYHAVVYNSPRHGMDVVLLEGVEGFSDIEIHIGNFPQDTEGCILVGEYAEEDAVMNSALAFNQMMHKVKASQGDLVVTIRREGK